MRRRARRRAHGRSRGLSPAKNHLPPFIGKIVTIAFNLGLIVLVLRFIVNPMILHFGDDDEAANATHGTARFATDKEIAPMTQSQSGLLIGRTFKSNKLLRYDGPAHLLTIAPTRTGKGVGTVIPNLLTLDRSIVCVDPKGDNTRVAGAARNRFGPVHVLDPFGVTGVASASYNPVALLDPAGIDVAEDAATLADALVYDPPCAAGEAHWNEEAKALIAGILLYIVAEETPERRTLATLREYLIARHRRSYERGGFVFDPLHYLALIEQKPGALDQAAPLQGWDLPDGFAHLRRLLEARMGNRGKREFIQVLRLIEVFDLTPRAGTVVTIPSAPAVKIW